MATVAKEFHTSLKAKAPAKVNVTTLIIQSNDVYKGDFETVKSLLKIITFAGDYADVYETNTRWVFENGVWTDTKQPIPTNPTLATKQDVADTNVRVAALEDAIAHPTLVITKI